MNKERGFITLSAVLVLSAIFLTLVAGTVIRSINLSKLITAVEASAKSEELAAACADYALVEIVQNLAYAGDESVDFQTGSCDILPIDDSLSNERTIEVEATVEGHVARLVVTLSAISPDVVIDRYHSVTTF